MEGKKQYDREFLMKLQQDPLSMTKPENLPNMDIIKDKATAKISSGVPGTKLGDIFNPSFVKPTISNRVRPQNIFDQIYLKTLVIDKVQHYISFIILGPPG